MKVINIDTEQYNKITFDYRECLTGNSKKGENVMRSWFRYMNYPKDTKVYKLVRPNGVKYIVEEK